MVSLECVHNGARYTRESVDPDECGSVWTPKIQITSACLVNCRSWSASVLCITFKDNAKAVQLSSLVKVEALWFGCYGVIIWFLSSKNESEWFLLFSLSIIFLRYSCAQFSVCVLRKFIIITSLRSYVLG